MSDPNMVVRSLVRRGALPEEMQADASVTLRQELHRAVRRMMSSLATAAAQVVVKRQAVAHGS